MSTVHRARAGDIDAVGDVATWLYPHLRRFYRRWYRPKWESWALDEDLVQEALVRITRTLRTSQADTEEGFLGWCITVARNIGIDHLRATRAEAAQREFELLEQQIAPATEDIDASGSCSYSRALAAAYDAQPEHIQELLWCRLAEGQSWKEIALALGTTTSGAKRMYQRTQSRLRSVCTSTPGAPRGSHYEIASPPKQNPADGHNSAGPRLRADRPPSAVAPPTAPSSGPIQDLVEGILLRLAEIDDDLAGLRRHEEPTILSDARRLVQLLSAAVGRLR